MHQGTGKFQVSAATLQTLKLALSTPTTAPLLKRIIIPGIKIKLSLKLLHQQIMPGKRLKTTPK
jgi:hypothetical protein